MTPLTEEQKAAYRRGRLLHLLEDLWDQMPDKSFWDIILLIHGPHISSLPAPTDAEFCDSTLKLVRETPRGKERLAALAAILALSQETEPEE